jgi:hypothetical protein
MEQSESEADCRARLERFYEHWSDSQSAFVAYFKKEWDGEKLGMFPE